MKESEFIDGDVDLRINIYSGQIGDINDDVTNKSPEETIIAMIEADLSLIEKIEVCLKKTEAIMKVYGAEICIDCRNYKAIQKSRGFAAEYVEITENTANLKEFLALRDSDPVFDEVRAHNGIGIPLFVNEDGRKTLDINEAFAWIGQAPVLDEEIR